MPLISKIRKQLALPKVSWQLCLLAIVGGCASALLVVLFSVTIDAIKAIYGTYFINYNSLTLASRMLIPISGAVMIILVWKAIGYKHIKVGIPFVLHRLTVSYGIIPVRNTINQFFGAAIAVASGFSVGKEGPSVHLGAACASFIGDKLNLPFNSIRTLSACCIAAGISACFNTPITAVIFVMEVILREYKVHVLIPIILAAIVGSLVTSHTLGAVHEFDFFTPFSLEVTYYPYLIAFGLMLGVLASAFNYQLTTLMKKVQKVSLTPRFLTAAIITGGLSYLLPNAFTDNMIQVSSALDAHWEFKVIAIALLAKLFMTVIALGLGIPGGVIGPIISIGAIAGVVAAFIVTLITGNTAIASDFALMGMSGFMAAALNAPLAALLIVVEFSNQLNIIVPAMITIATSCLVSRQLFNNNSIFFMQLDALSIPYRKPPIERSLQNIGTIGVMHEDFVIHDKVNTEIRIAKWINSSDIAHVNTDKSRASKHALFISQDNTNELNTFYWHEVTLHTIQKEPQIKVHQLIPLTSQATLAEAYLLLQGLSAGGVYIYHEAPNQLVGVITFEQIQQYLTQGQLTE